jgi:hypothetical protein
MRHGWRLDQTMQKNNAPRSYDFRSLANSLIAASYKKGLLYMLQSTIAWAKQVSFSLEKRPNNLFS